MLEVRSGLLLGGAGDAMAVFSRVKSVTKVHNVTHVLTVANERVDWSPCTDQPDDDNVVSKKIDTENSSPDKETEEQQQTSSQKEAGNFKTKFVCLPDLPTSDLLHHFESCCQFVKDGVQRGAVLVHCQHGISRSVTIVLAYLMWSEGRSFKVLHDELKEKKPEIRPNAGFVEQLKLWEAMRCKIDESNKLYKAYRLKHMAREMKDTGMVEDLHASPDPFIQAIESTAYYKCRKCRRLLFTDESVLQHELGKGQSAFKWHKRSKPVDTFTGTAATASDEQPANSISPTSGEKTTEPEEDKQQDDTTTDLILEDTSTLSASPPNPQYSPDDLAKIRAEVASVVALSSQPSKACSSFFLEPLQWMETALLGTVEGKILCPKCNARLGSFNWSGDQCSCGQWVTPSFQVHRAKVDETRSLSKRKNVPKQT